MENGEHQRTRNHKKSTVWNKINVSSRHMNVQCRGSFVCKVGVNTGKYIPIKNATNCICVCCVLSLSGQQDYLYDLLGVDSNKNIPYFVRFLLSVRTTPHLQTTYFKDTFDFFSGHGRKRKTMQTLQKHAPVFYTQGIDVACGYCKIRYTI